MKNVFLGFKMSSYKISLFGWCQMHENHQNAHLISKTKMKSTSQIVKYRFLAGVKCTRTTKTRT